MGKTILVFEVCGRQFGLESKLVREVIRAVTIAPLPQPSHCVEGIVSLRGAIVPVVGMRALLCFPTREIELSDHLIVIEHDSWLVALHVDHAADLIKLEETQCESSQSMHDLAPMILFEAKMPDGIIHVLDPDQFELRRIIGLTEDRKLQVMEGADG